MAIERKGLLGDIIDFVTNPIESVFDAVVGVFDPNFKPLESVGGVLGDILHPSIGGVENLIDLGDSAIDIIDDVGDTVIGGVHDFVDDFISSGAELSALAGNPLTPLLLNTDTDKTDQLKANEDQVDLAKKRTDAFLEGKRGRRRRDISSRRAALLGGRTGAMGATLGGGHTAEGGILGDSYSVLGGNKGGNTLLGL